ncbi:MAG: 5-(carboxyamino)imidazole ribonucleotide synthase, partial [Dermatophilaceae bacterium]
MARPGSPSDRDNDRGPRPGCCSAGVVDGWADPASRTRHRKSLLRSPTATVAMIGAGQLARMTHQAAVDLDIELRVLAESPDDSAVVGGAPYRLGSAASLVDLEGAAAGADVVTFDHELVPATHLAKLQQLGYRLRPGPPALRLAQDKLEARQVLSAAGFPTPVFAPISSLADVADFAERHGWPVVVKSQRGGYDGRGVHVIDNPDQLAGIFGGNRGEGPVWLVEQFVDIAAELSILIARTSTGHVAVYPAVQTTQRAGICKHLVMPAPLPSHILEQAGRFAKSIADGIDATGMLAVEMFLTASGQLLVNELALRPHNSGHATIEACVTSQFHQHLRAILDWPLGCTDLRVPAAAMVNLI